jgi:hypothetical protein
MWRQLLSWDRYAPATASCVCVQSLKSFVEPLRSPVPTLLFCVGTPSAAASGAIAANTMNPVGKHIEMLKEASKRDPLYKFLDPGPFANLYRPFVEGLTPSPELKVPAARAAE